MSKSMFLENVGRTFHQIGFKLKKHSPAILISAGIVGTVAGTVMACKATLKVNDILDETKDHVEKIHQCMENPELKETGQYTEKDGKKDLTAVYVQTGVKLAKLYAPAVVVSGLSIASILASYKILNTRNVALSAAYTIVDKSFKDYRKRVKDRFGDQVDKELRHGIKAEMVDVITVDENGNEQVEAKMVDVATIDENSDYAIFFDESCKYWEKDAEYNKMFLKQVERTATRKLIQQGHLYLNEVYKMLGAKETRAGQMVGWIYDKENPIGDNKVDFGIFDVHNEAKRNFVNGYERSILIDFNVDGNILDLMPWKDGFNYKGNFYDDVFKSDSIKHLL